MGNRPYLTRTQFEEKLREEHGEIFTVQFSNYPRSIFYYNRTQYFDEHSRDNIGIYTNETTYGFGNC
jgi:hypothetical protein